METRRVIATAQQQRYNLYRYRFFTILALAACVGCKNYSTELSNQFIASGKESIDLKKVVLSQWDRVCVIGPYTDNNTAEKALGFKWPVENYSAIKDSDRISLLLFIRGNSVIEHIDHPRNEGDFANLSGQCFSPSEAKFKRVKNPPDDWPRLVQANEA